jgi:hypothetical protein
LIHGDSNTSFTTAVSSTSADSSAWTFIWGSANTVSSTAVDAKSVAIATNGSTVDATGTSGGLGAAVGLGGAANAVGTNGGKAFAFALVGGNASAVATTAGQTAVSISSLLGTINFSW